MFRAVRRHDRESVSLLGRRWSREAVEALRAVGRKDGLLCPHCDGPVLIRAGNLRAWHFAHKTLSDCPLGNEPAERVLLRRILHDWILGKEPGEVEVEVAPAGLAVPRPFDVWARGSNGRRFGYWVFARGIRSPEAREQIIRLLRKRSPYVHVVFSKRMLRLKKGRRIDLTPTERGFARFLRSGFGRSLHYLDSSRAVLTSVRGIRKDEGPSRHRYRYAMTDAVGEILISPLTGEFVHPGERKRFTPLVKKRKKKRKAELRERRAAEPRPSPAAASLPRDPGPRPEDRPLRPERPAEAAPRRKERRAPCEGCGRMIREEDQIIYDGRTGLCVCRDCLKRRGGGSAGRPRRMG